MLPQILQQNFAAKIFHVVTFELKSSHHSSMAGYQRGPGFKSRQGREFNIVNRKDKSYDCILPKGLEKLL